VLDNVQTRSPNWWERAVVYQIYPRSFQDSNGDGIGDLGGVRRRLPYLADLGVDVIWLSPIYTSPQVDNGYDISNYRDIDPSFGTLEEFDQMVAEAHELGIKIMMDVVVNHTSSQHPWFLESRDPASAKRDWYFWRDAKPGATPGTPGAEPDSSVAAFAPSAWYFDETSGQYYLGLFSAGQPDLNWENPDVRQAAYEMMRWWLDRGVDGFRLDVINLISKPERITEGPLGDGDLFADSTNGRRLDEFLAEMNREVALSQRNVLTVGEMPGATVEVARNVTGPDRNELTMVFTFEHMDIDGDGSKWNHLPLDLPALKRNLATWQEGLAGQGWNSLYFDNHDQPRVVSRFGDDSPQHREASAKTIATTLHLHQGTPYIYQGEELGMTNYPFTSIDQIADVESLNFFTLATADEMTEADAVKAIAAKGRDNARTPVQWDASHNAGFTTGTPWLAVNPNYPQINAEAQVADPNSVWQHYRKLISLRHDEALVTDGEFSLLLPDHPALWAFTRSGAEGTLLVLANWSTEPVALPVDELPELTGAQLLLGTHDDQTDSALQPWESRILRLQ